MMYVRSKVGYVNLATAHAIELVDGEKAIVTAGDVERHVVEVEDVDSYDFINGPTTIVPALEPLTLHVIFVREDDSVDHSRYPIVAWRIRMKGPPEPVAVNYDFSEKRYWREECFIELPDGKFVEPNGPESSCVHGSLDDCIEAAKKWVGRLAEIKKKQA
jgi:hypothetical protein